jgi:enamine deaminase RidA (YjgF/YER057c/UK114 family)
MGSIRTSGGNRWQQETGYSRAVRVGPLVEVSSTCAAEQDGTIVHLGDVVGQTRHIIGTIEAALREVGASLADVVRVSYYMRDQADWVAVGEVHREFFGETRPALDYIFTAGWPLKGVEIEIVCTAYVDDAA